MIEQNHTYGLTQTFIWVYALKYGGASAQSWLAYMQFFVLLYAFFLFVICMFWFVTRRSTTHVGASAHASPTRVRWHSASIGQYAILCYIICMFLFRCGIALANAHTPHPRTPLSSARGVPFPSYSVHN